MTRVPTSTLRIGLQFSTRRDPPFICQRLKRRTSRQRIRSCVGKSPSCTPYGYARDFNLHVLSLCFLRLCVVFLPLRICVTSPPTPLRDFSTAMPLWFFWRRIVIVLYAFACLFISLQFRVCNLANFICLITPRVFNLRQSHRFKLSCEWLHSQWYTLTRTGRKTFKLSLSFFICNVFYCRVKLFYNEEVSTTF